MRYRLLVLLLFRFSFSDMKNAGPVSGTGIDYFVSLLENFVHRLLEVISYRSGCFVAGTVVPARAVVTTEVTALATVFATVSTFTALATRATVVAVVAVIALAAISARLALRLNISFRLLYECPHRETHLTGLGIDLKEFDIHFSPTLSTSSTLSVLVQAISDTWSRPSFPGRISTKAPNSRMETTFP